MLVAATLLSLPLTALAVDVLAPTSNPWITKAPSPVARSEANGTVVGGKVYVFGGFNASLATMARSDAYDPGADSWQQLADMPVQLTHSPALVDGTTIWLIGGFVGNHPGPSTTDVWKYETTTNAWSRGPSLPLRRGAGGAAIVDRVIHYFGGTDRPAGSTNSPDEEEHWALDLKASNPQWVPRANMPNSRNHLAGVTLDGKLYAIGGQYLHNESSGNQAEVDRYDPATDTWTRVADLPDPRGHITASSFVVNGDIVVIGGTLNGDVPAADVTAYDSATNAWRTLPSLPAGRKTPIAGLIGDLVVSTTGAEPGPTTTTWVALSTDLMPPPPPPFVESGGQVVMEAENPHSKIDRGGKSWILETSPTGHVGSGHMFAQPNTGTQINTGYATTSPQLNYDIKFTATGTYHVWLRGQGAGDLDNSVHVGLDGQPLASADRIQVLTYNAWTWFNGTMDGPVATINVTSTGVHSVNLWMREDGVRIDRVLLTTDSGYTPTGSGPGVPPDPGVWATRAPNGPSRQEVSFVNAGGKLYLAGGLDGAGAGSAAHEVYDPPTNSWTTLRPLPVALDHVQGVELEGLIYYIGGFSSWPSPHVNTVYIYNPSTDSYTQGTPMPTGRARGAGGVAVHAGKIYYAGGVRGDGGPAVPWFDVYDPAARTWTQLADMPRPRDHFHAAVVNGKFYAIGGRNRSENAATTANDAYNFSTSAWSTGLAPLPTARGGFATAVLGDEILVIGGEGGGKAHEAVEAYNTATNTWRTLNRMMTPRHGIQAAVCNGGVYVAAGGVAQSVAPTNVHEVFFLDSPTTCGPTAGTSLPIRVNAGGPGLAGSPSWSADTQAAPSGFVNAAVTGNTTYATTAPIDTSHASIPAGTPAAIFQDERFDGAAAPELQWDFPVSAGARYEVRLYFAEIFFTTPGQRAFNVSIEGQPVLTGYDIVADVGAKKGVVKSFTVTSDANLDIDFARATENPTVTAIEIVQASSTADTTPPTVASVSPAEGATGVAASANASALFSEAIDAATVGASTFSLVKQGGTTVLPAAVTYDASTKSATLNPNSDLEAGASYTATVKGGSGGVKDAAGNALAADKGWSFTVAAAADVAPPTVVSVSPAEGATGVAASANASALFSEAIDAATIGASTFSLVKQGGTTVLPAAVTYDASTKTATLNPNTDLEAGAGYTATVKGGSGGVKDSAGNALAADKVWSFTVAAPPPPPGGGPVVYRVNAGGAALSGTPSWSADSSAAPSQYVNAAATGNTTYATAAPIDTSHVSIPAGTPAAIFQDERFDGAAAPELQWDFPVSAGARYEVRLYFAEIYFTTPGQRAFNVSIEGQPVLTGYDIVADVGAKKGVVKSFTVTSDANLDIDFAHATENPTVTAIEIVQPAVKPSQLGAAPTSLDFGNVGVNVATGKSVQLTNLGGAGDPSIVVDATSIGGTDAGQFTDSFDDATNVTLAPGASTTVTVTFKPTSTGTKSATLSVAHSGTNTPLSIPLGGSGSDSGGGGTGPAFGKSKLAGTSSSQVTSLQFGPDGRLYVAQQNGLIKVYTAARSGPNSYTATATETITAIQSIPNHNDDGTLNSGVNTRIVTGILVTGTAAAPIIYATSSDPRIGGGDAGTDTGLDTNSSMLSRLKWNGTSWQRLDLVRGLSRSEENHSANGIQLVGNLLYISQGGNTNMGAPSHNFAKLPETALSAAVLKVDLGAIGESTYDLPTLDDENRPGASDAGDPFGGNNGKNQAKLVPGGPVQVHAPGFRNPYDLLIHSSGRMYTVDNGGNAGWGGPPVKEGPQGICTNDVSEPGTTGEDSFHLILASKYGGHPNPTRGNMANTFNASNPQSPVSTANAVECDFRSNGPEKGNIHSFTASTNGLTEYTASNFSGAMKDDFLAASFDNSIYRVKLNSSGAGLVLAQKLFSTVDIVPLDVTAVGDIGKFPGTIWVGDVQSDQITVFEPNDYGGGSGTTCTGANNATLDEDLDGFRNDDEISNGTNPCSAADVPPDWDGDKISNKNDPNDDNDNQIDTTDPFAIDPKDGTTTTLPVRYTWDNDAPAAGGILNLGFTGLMTNGVANYEALYDPTKMTAGGAAGVTTVDEASEGDALGATNTQEYGLQFGLKPPTAGVFTAHTRISAPFSGLTPQDNQSAGLFIGNGHQDNYVKIVTSANGGAGGIQFLKEVGGTVTSRPQAPTKLPGADSVDLYLTVDPVAGTVQPSYSINTGGTPGTRVLLGAAEPIPGSWLNGTSGLAVGLISTSAGAAPPFAATWELIEVTTDGVPDTTAPIVTSRTPATGASGIATTTNVSAVFSEAMNSASITASTFTLVKQGATSPLAAAVSYDATTKMATLDPSAELEAGAGYTATVKGGSSGVKDLAGNALAVDDSWSFTVAAAADTTPPTVASVSPTDGATGVAASANASAVFSEGMDATSISGSTFGLVKEGTIVSLAASIAYDVTSKTATLDPNLDLEPGARYTATVKGGSGGVKDSAGNALAQDKVWSFIIAPPLARDFFARTVSGGWGTAEVGGAWSILNGAASNFAVNGSQATLNTPKGGAQQAAHLGSLSARDLDARVQLTVPTALNGSRNLVTYLLLRNQSSGTHYRIGLVLTPRDELFIRGETGVGARLFADVDTALRFTPGNTFVLRVQVQGGSPTTIRARVWRSGAPEPSPWAIVHSDATAALQTAGSVGIRMINDSNTAVRVELDDFLVARLP